MQFRDLKAQYAALKDEIDAQIAEVIENTSFISGKKVCELEEQLADYVGKKHCITCANGTDALQLALMAWNIGSKDAVFVPDFTFFSSGEVVSAVGATPVFVDVCEDTYNISPEHLEQVIEKTIEDGQLKPKVIVAVDLFGQPAEYDRIKQIADKYGLKILEDGAQGFGGSINDRIACSFGDISTTSFFPAKPLGCYGDGGAIFTDDDDIAAILSSLRIHGKGESKYDNVRIGMNSRLDTIQAALLIPKFKAFREYELDAVNALADKYNEALCGVVKTPVVKAGYRSSWAQYTIQLKDAGERNGLQAYLKEQGIPSMIYYQKPMHEQKAFDGIKQYDDFGVTAKLCETVLSLPMHPYMKDDEFEKIVSCIKDYVG
ncbi:MAG: DegT/DnrJ/EryC1/StrS family aminotransferase [Bacteroides sp.]